MPSHSDESDDSLPRVSPVDLSDLSPDDFRDDEFDIPYHLVHFHRLANAVRETGEYRGFVDIPVWRNERDTEPFNARIMENWLSLSYFYTEDRPWNPYYGDEAVRVRLEAAMEFWAEMQHEDGRFSEYGQGEWNLAATAFATKFGGEALVKLADGPPIDDGVYERATSTLRRAIHVTLTDEDLFEYGRHYSNQFTNVWAGAGAYLSLYDDDEIERLLAERLEDSIEAFQSPAGYFYENDGPDWNYSLNTHHSNLRMAYHYLEETDLEPQLIEKERRWAEWMAYGAVLEPSPTEKGVGDSVADGKSEASGEEVDRLSAERTDDRGFVVNRGGDTRMIRRTFDRHETPLADHVPIARAFAPVENEQRVTVEHQREELERAWPVLDDLPVGEFTAFTPYAFLHRTHDDSVFSAKERADARAELPYLAADRFVHQRVDDRTDFAATYVRRPSYYAAFNAAPTSNGHQRFGLGLIWHPDAGAVFQSGAGHRGGAFGTRPDTEEDPYEADGIEVTYEHDGRSIETVPGGRDIDGGEHGEFRATYPLGTVGEKTVSFEAGGINVHVEHGGEFVETIPLVADPKSVEQIDDGLRVHYGSGVLSLTRTGADTVQAFDTDVDVEASPTPSPDHATPEESDAKRLVVVRVHATDELSYDVSFDQA